MAPSSESSPTDFTPKKHGRGRPRKGEERIKKPYVPTGRPRGRPKGSRNAKSATSVSPTTPKSTTADAYQTTPVPEPTAQYATASIPVFAGGIGHFLADPTNSGFSNNGYQEANMMNGGGRMTTATTVDSKPTYTASGRPRGRPRKDGLPPQANKMSVSERSTSAIVPETNVSEVAVAAAMQLDAKPKRGRGRPRKDAFQTQ